MYGLGGNAFWLAIRQLSLRLGFVLASLILAPRIPLSDFATYAFFVMTINLFASYATLGVGVSSSQYFAIARKGATQYYSITSVVHIYIVLIGLSTAAIYFLPSDVLTGQADIPKLILAIGVVAFSLDAIPGGAAMGLEKYKALAGSAILYFFVAMTGIIGAAVYGSAGAAIWVWIVAATVKAAGSIFVVLRNRRLWLRSEQPTGRGLTSALKFVGPLAVVSILSATALWFGGWMHLNIVDDPEQYPQYAIGLQWFALGLFVPQLVAQTIIPRLAGASNKSNGNNAAYLRRAVQSAFLAGIVICTLGAVISTLVVPLYGDILTADRLILPTYILAAIPYAIVNTIGNAFVANRAQWFWLASSVVYQSIFICLSFAFIDLGAISGSIAIAFAGAVQSMLLLRQARILKII